MTDKKTPNLRAFLLTGFGLTLLSIAGAIIAGDASNWWWYAATSATAVALPALVAISGRKGRYWFARLQPILFLIIAIGVVVGYGASHFGFDSARLLETILYNRNIVATTVALHGFVAAILYRKWWLPISALTLVSVVVSGNRSAVVVVVIAIALTWLSSSRRNQWRVAIFALVGLSVAVATPMLLNSYLENAQLNATNKLAGVEQRDASTWDTRYSRVISQQISSSAQPTEAEIRRGSAPVLSFTLGVNPDSAYPSIALRKSGLTATVAADYVASVYLRSDTPGSLVLSTNHSSVVCEISSSWNRCVTPPANASPGHNLQFQLRFPPPFVEAGAESQTSFEMWGPQLEEGTVASEFQLGPPAITTRNTVRRLVRRLDVRTWRDDVNVTSRLAAFSFAAKQIVKAPIAGYGVASFTPNYATEVGAESAIAHSHNLILEVLFERGLIGLVVFLGHFAAVFIFLGRHAYAWWLLIFVLALEIVNISFYSSAIYYVFWLAFTVLAMWHSTRTQEEPAVGPELQ